MSVAHGRVMFQQRHFEALAEMMQGLALMGGTANETRAGYQQRFTYHLNELFAECKAFQRRHRNALTAMVQKLTPNTGLKSETLAEYQQRFIDRMCRLFADDNEEFNEARFRLACVPGNKVHGNRNVGPAMPYVRGR